MRSATRHRESGANAPPRLYRGDRGDRGIRNVTAATTSQPSLVALHDIPFVLGRGDAMVLYTDGVTEARSGRGAELFGDDRLAAVLTGCHGRAR